MGSDCAIATFMVLSASPCCTEYIASEVRSCIRETLYCSPSTVLLRSVFYENSHSARELNRKRSEPSSIGFRVTSYPYTWDFDRRHGSPDAILHVSQDPGNRHQSVRYFSLTNFHEAEGHYKAEGCGPIVTPSQSITPSPVAITALCIAIRMLHCDNIVRKGWRYESIVHRNHSASCESSPAYTCSRLQAPNEST